MRKTSHHLTLPEIKDFNALDDKLCFRYFALCFKGQVKG